MLNRIFTNQAKNIRKFKPNFQKFFNSSLHNTRDHEKNVSSTSWLAENDKDFKVTIKESHLQFSKNPILENFGELPYGEIPEPLKYVRPFEMTVLDNGIRVCTEQWDSPLCAVGAFIDAGSRYETLETSGTAHFLEHLLFKGTKNRTKSQFEAEIENIGSTLDAYTSREHTLFHMQCFPSNVKHAVNILGDIIQNPSLSKTLLEQEKDTIRTELEESNKDVQETIMEAVHFTAYRDHYMGQPILGDIDNINNVTQDMVKEYHATHYIGKNLIIVGTGNVNHKEFVDMVASQLGNLNKNAPPGLERKNTEKPVFIPSCMFMRDDELYNAGIGVFYDAPSWYHEDYYAFLLLERIFGDYQIDKHGAAHVNNPKKQYRLSELWLSHLPDVTKAQSIYSPYRDCGLFGNYFYGNEVHVRHMVYTGLALPPVYGYYLNQVEVYRARARLWQELLNMQSPTDVLQLIGPQVLYLNRRVHRSEIAKRISYLDNNTLRRVYRDWLNDAEPVITAYGPIEEIAQVGSYKYYKANTYITPAALAHNMY